MKPFSNRACLVAAFAFLVLAVSLPARAGIVVAREFRSSALDRNGGNLYSWVNDGHIQQTADALIARGDIPPCVIVMPDAGTSWFVDRKENMETAVIADLIPDVEKNWKVLSSRPGRLVAGLSMGGYGAMRFSLKYPELFAAAALLSPAIYNPEPPENSSARRVGVFGAPDYDAAVWKAYNYPVLWDAYLVKKLPVPMYINSGDDDDFFIEAEATQFYSLLRRNKQPAELRIVNGAHVWQVWESTIGDAMKYIFRYSARPAAGEPVR
jgi:enterochelin esterase-like enzyme